MYKSDDMPFKECNDCFFWLRGSGCQRVGGCRYGFVDGVPPICVRCFWFDSDLDICIFEGDCPKGVFRPEDALDGDCYDDYDEFCPDEDYPGVSSLDLPDDDCWSGDVFSP